MNEYECHTMTHHSIHTTSYFLSEYWTRKALLIFLQWIGYYSCVNNLYAKTHLLLSLPSPIYRVAVCIASAAEAGEGEGDWVIATSIVESTSCS